MIALTLAKGGMYGGNPETVLNSPVDIVMHSYHFLDFMNVFENTTMELNRGNK